MAPVQRASARDVVRVTFFKQNEQRRNEILRQILTARGAERFAGLRPEELDPTKQWLEEFGPKGKDAAKKISVIRRLGAPVLSEMGLPPLRIPTSAVTTSFKADILDGTHLAADTYKVAL